MGCCSSNNVQNNAPVHRPIRQNNVENNQNNNQQEGRNVRSLSERFRQGELPERMSSTEFANLLPMLNQPAVEENKNSFGPRAESYVIDDNGPRENEGFDDMIRRLNEQKRKFYEKFGRLPKSSNDTSPEYKITALKEKLKAYQVSFTQGCNVLEVDRNNILEDSIDTFLEMDHQKELKIIFKAETKDSGQDAGGMEKEWFNLVSEALLDDKEGLFRATETEEISYTIKESSWGIQDYYKKFDFIGQVLAKAIFDEIPLNLWLNKLIFKLLLNPEADVGLEDLKMFDTQVYNSLKYIQDNQINEDEYFEQYYEHEHDGEMYPLVPDGSELKVTDENKNEFINLKTEFMIKNFVIEQVHAIRNGFEKLIKLDLLKDFTDSDFCLLCWGESKIDLNEWKRNTEYSGDYNANHKVIKWFWNLMEELKYNQESLRIIFQFVTGMSRLPAGGFSCLNKNRGQKQNFTIRSVDYFQETPYPKAYTWFNRMHLPKYPDEDTLRKNVRFLIKNKEIYGFGIE